ncbi:F-box/WD repeat-containing protein 12-like isoform X1 [Entelurus aequoreus]|uniref:F-box/WD repeat-containing protein 12-like isoform X1 n=1 Tax=Entelurus aequoreus TaxID=161455 RepID=UPI002B1E3E26|nr:F-box/WD repeat-containing protein 12-like isoform X1 [Entelurus aequoreus]
MNPQTLISDCLLHIFTFLPVEDLISASGVCKDWQDAAETQWLWRRLCLQRWLFCSQVVLSSSHVNRSWKKYFLRRSCLEKEMKDGRSGGYTCKSLRGHTGSIVGVVYLQVNSPGSPDPWSTSSTVCSAATDGSVRAWNVQTGEQLWCGQQQRPLTCVTKDERGDFVATADSSGDIKVWQALTGQEVALYHTASTHCTLLLFNKDQDCFLSVGTNQGNLVTLSAPSLSQRSTLMISDTFKVNIVLISPDKNWIMAGHKDHLDFSPKVVYAESLTSPSEDQDPLCHLVPVSRCQAAVFMPGQSARLATIHRPPGGNSAVLSVFQVCLHKSKYKSQVQVEQVASFPLELHTASSNILLEAKDSSVLVMAAEHRMWVYSLEGGLIASYQEHMKTITSMCVDSFRVVTASQDLSLRVLTWGHDGDDGLALDSRYHLLGGSHTMSRGFTHVCCDYSSIVGAVEGKNGKDVLKAYTFTSSVQVSHPTLLV